MTLFPFKSRWITLFRWRKATPSRICWVYKAKTLSGRGPNLWAKKEIDQREFEWAALLWFGKRSEGHLWRMLAMDPPGTYSMKMETTCWYKEVPRKPTMLMCLSVFSSSTSSCRRLYSPFASLGLEVSRLTCFTAINWPWLVRPQYTWWEVLVIKYLWISVYVHLYRIARMCKKKKPSVNWRENTHCSIRSSAEHFTLGPSDAVLWICPTAQCIWSVCWYELRYRKIRKK